MNDIVSTGPRTLIAEQKARGDSPRQNQASPLGSSKPALSLNPESLPGALDNLSGQQTEIERFTSEFTLTEQLLGERSATLDEYSVANQQSGNEDFNQGWVGGAALGSAWQRSVDVIVGKGEVNGDIAAKILGNVADSRPPYRPELGKFGGVSWFTTEGTPYTGTKNASPVNLSVEVSIPRTASVVEFREKDLIGIYDSVYKDAYSMAESELRQSKGLAANDALSNNKIRDIKWNANKIAERQMWEQVGERVGSSKSGFGRVYLENSRFSTGKELGGKGAANGVFTLSKQAGSIQVQGGSAALLDAVKQQGVPAEKAVVEAVEDLARQEKISGRVEGVYRTGGRLLIVTAVAADGYRIYSADDKVRESVKVAGGWAGATGAVAAYNAATGSSNVAGPWAWAANAVGNLAAGGVGYFAGEKASELVYDIVVEPEPVTIPANTQ